MTNWALQTGWTGLRGKGKGRATDTPLAAHKADQRNSTPQRRQGAKPWARAVQPRAKALKE